MRRPADSTLWNFLKSRSEVSLPRVMAIAALSGLANALLIAVINSAAHETTTDQPDVQKFLLFIVALVTYIVTQRYILRVSQIEIEKIIEKIRLGLSDKIRRSDLHSIETLGRSQLYASVNTDTLALSRAVQPLMIACQSVLLVLFSLGYIFMLEPAAFFLTLLICGVGIAIHFRNKKQLVFELEQATEKENELFDVLTHLLDGFKEVKLSSARNRDLYAHLQEIAAQAAHYKTRTGIRYADYYLFTQVMFQLLLAAMVFILPQVSSTLVQADQITSLTASILFIMGPLTVVVGALPQLRTATHAIDNVSRLDQALDIAQELSRDRDNGDIVKALDFQTIEIRQGVFSHKDKDGRAMFTLGPLNCTITRNETVLVVGGNGSGKSTFFKVLTGLYYLDTGAILVDGVDIKSLGYRRYRELFSAIFSDYHLFARLYGLTNVDDSKVEELLRVMQLEHKTSWRDGRFENQDLSTGQKKRLALIISLLEDKPVCVFDEWAADQDPQFRQFFYDTLLPELKAKGKTVIAASHDDRFFSVGDRVLKMEMGQFVPFAEVESA